jgi:hypothetical protein
MTKPVEKFAAACSSRAGFFADLHLSGAFQTAILHKSGLKAKIFPQKKRLGRVMTTPAAFECLRHPIDAAKR